MTAIPEKFVKVEVWDTDAKGSRLTPSQGITRIAPGGVYRHSALMEADDYKLSVFLGDSVAASLSKGNYFECNVGHAGHQSLWYAGYVDQIQKTDGIQKSYDIVGVSALAALSSYRNGDALHASWGLGYHNVLQRFNGINLVGTPAGTNQKGLLPNTWQAVWVDGTFTPAGTTTTTGTNAVNQTDISVSASAGINVTNRAVQIGSDWYGLDPTTPNPDGTHIRIVAPGTIRSYSAGTTVKMASYKLPGTGDSWFTANDTAFNGLKSDCSRYNLYFRMRAGSLAHNGVVEVGPLLDSSGLQIWGGTQLAAQQGYDTVARSYQASAADAQASSLAVIEQATYVDDLSKVVNVVWPFGKGKGDHARLIKAFTGGDPTGNGWTSYVPYANDRQYYIKNASAATWDGDTFEFITFQRQDGGWQVGVINRGSNLSANQAPPYGIHEATIKDSNITDPYLLLAKASGTVQFLADPIPTYSFDVRHPITSVSGVPTVPVPGQSIDVRFTGEVHNAIDLNASAGPTYGQYVSVGSYRYIKFPTNGDPTDENGSVAAGKVAKMQRMTSIEDSWTADGGYKATYVMGAGPLTQSHILNGLARDMTTAKHEPDPQHTFTKRNFDQVAFFMPNTPPLAYEDPSNHTLILQAGTFTVSDVPHSYFFDDAHSVTYTLQLTDTAQCLDFIFGKTPDGTLTTLASSGIYGLLRLAGSSSALASGFFTTTNGTSLTARGGVHPNNALDVNKRMVSWTSAAMRLHISWHNNKYVASLTAPDVTNVQTPVRFATWNDTGPALAKWGAIGFHLVGGSANGKILDLHAHPIHSHPPQKDSVGVTQLNPTHPASKATGMNAAQYSSGRGGASGTGRAATAIPI